MKKLFISLLAVWSLCTSTTQAAILKFDKGVQWASFRNLSSAQFSQKFQEYSDKGYLVTDFDAQPVGNSARYSMVLRKNPDNRKWALHRNLTSQEFGNRWQELADKGYRLLDFESYTINGARRYAGVWVKNKEGYAWSSKRNMTSTQYGTYFQEQKDKGFRMIDMEAYSTSNGTRYASVWVKDNTGILWAQLRNMSRATYNQEVTSRLNAGYVMVDYESYQVNGVQKYAAIWEKRSGFAQQIRTNLTYLEFSNRWREYRDKGFRLVDFERYTTSNGTRYGGIWIENDTRYRYSRKNTLNNLVSTFQSDNNLPGVSVAIVRNGTMLYRRGFGFADQGQGKVAHGGSIYLTASVSKVIGGTLATKLHDERRLRNGVLVNFDLNRTTRSYLTSVRKSDGTFVTLPNIHTHTLAQLFAHLGCIPHYSTGPEPTIQHYNRSIDALTQIWNSKLNSCTTGTNRNYSTHAFTYIAAALERATGRRSADLVRSELAVPYGLPTMRALYAQSTIPYDYDRVRPYNSSNVATTFSNNSWKIWGGGIESSPVDLAWFGWKVLNGNIVNANARDNVLWQRVSPNSNNGIAWGLGTSNSRQIAEHTGSWTGTRTHLRVYRNDGLVIAIMANRSNVTGMGTLMNDLANAVLNNGRPARRTPRARTTDQNLTQLANQLRVYPNPAENEVAFQGAGVQIKQVQAQNLLGKIWKLAVRDNRTSLENLPKGLYILTITTDRGKVIKKVIKK